jgi:hypothetical protein
VPPDLSAIVAGLAGSGTDDGPDDSRGDRLARTGVLALEQRLQQREQELARALLRIAGLEAALEAR